MSLLLGGCIAPSGPPGSFPSDDWFFRLGRCEQPGSGYQGIQWDSRGAYNGGLGFLPATWDDTRDPTWPANMADAIWEQQVIAARRLYARYGPEPWGCSSVAGPAY